VLAAGLLSILFYRVSWGDLRASVDAAPLALVGAYVLAMTTVLLGLDGWATRRGLAVSGLSRPLGEVIAIRGATYLLGQLSYAAGQAGIGLYLRRLGLDGGRAVGVVLFLMAVNFWALLATGGVGLAVAGGVPWLDPRWALAVPAAAAAYLALVVARPPSLRRWPPLAPFFEAGVGGHLAAAGPRLVHAAALVTGLWIGLRLWGIPVPLRPGLGAIPVVFLIAALPLTPGGIGTTQAALVLLFSRHAEGADQAAREAAVLGFALAWSALNALAQIVAGGASLLVLRARGLDQDPRPVTQRSSDADPLHL
jgi:hypothetical protein